MRIALLTLLFFRSDPSSGHINFPVCAINEAENHRLDTTSHTPAFKTMEKIFEAINTADIINQKSIVPFLERPSTTPCQPF